MNNIHTTSSDTVDSHRMTTAVSTKPSYKLSSFGSSCCTVPETTKTTVSTWPRYKLSTLDSCAYLWQRRRLWARGRVISCPRSAPVYTCDNDDGCEHDAKVKVVIGRLFVRGCLHHGMLFSFGLIQKNVLSDMECQELWRRTKVCLFNFCIGKGICKKNIYLYRVGQEAEYCPQPEQQRKSAKQVLAKFDPFRRLRRWCEAVGAVPFYVSLRNWGGFAWIEGVFGRKCLRIKCMSQLTKNL